MTRLIIKKGSVVGAPVISIKIRHMLADMRISPPRKEAATGHHGLDLTLVRCSA
jgi:hypothetical protein